MATILVVDDDSGIRNLFRTCFESAGHEVLEASDGRAALRVIASRTPDVAFIDLLIPEMGGIETVRQIGASHPAVKMIVMSGAPPVHDPSLKVIERLGAWRILRKPVRIAALLETLREALAPT